jgi:dipeptidyl peptidase-like protein
MKGNQPSRAVDGFALSGVSNPPDPSTNAYRKDLADAALAGRVIASHYAEPLSRHLVAPAPFLTEPANDAEQIAELCAGDELRMLDLSLGWAWGYGPDGRVGYVSAEAVGP